MFEKVVFSLRCTRNTEQQISELLRATADGTYRHVTELSKIHLAVSCTLLLL